MSDELKPCPFCGGEARAFYSEEGGTFDVQCQQCGAIPFIGSRTSEIRTLDGVIAAWNARTERTCVLEDIPYEPGAWEGVRCSSCGVADEFTDLSGNYCPNCGAKIEVA